MDKRCNIGVFDSGVGGVSVLKEIKKVLPNENIIYFGDTKNIPYGNRSKKDIQGLSRRIIEFLIMNNCKAIVIACNTASIAALEDLQSHCNIPIIGIIDAGVQSVIMSKSLNIAILGTNFTIKSGEHLKKINKKNKKIVIKEIACEKLCPMVENGWENYSDRDKILEEYISQIPKETDTLLLACTHYPFIIEDIRKQFSGNILDPSKECAEELFRILKKYDIHTESKNNGKVEFYVTGDKDSFKRKAEKFLGEEIKDIYKVNI